MDPQLSDHTHGGRILGMTQLAAGLNNGFLYGCYHAEKVSPYVNSNASSWNALSVRSGIPSEIARIVLRGTA